MDLWDRFFEDCGVMELFWFQPFPSTNITGNCSKLFVDIFPHGAKHFLVARQSGSPTGDPCVAGTMFRKYAFQRIR